MPGRSQGVGTSSAGTRPVDRSGRLYVGEAAGLQDPAWGFGLRYALESGALAARCLFEGTDYEVEVSRLLEPVRCTATFNRQIFWLGSGRAAGSILGLVASSVDARGRTPPEVGSQGPCVRPLLVPMSALQVSVEDERPGRASRAVLFAVMRARPVRSGPRSRDPARGLPPAGCQSRYG